MDTKELFEINEEIEIMRGLLKRRDLRESEIIAECNHWEKKCSSLMKEVSKLTDECRSSQQDRVVSNLKEENAILRSKLKSKDDAIESLIASQGQDNDEEDKLMGQKAHFDKIKPSQDDFIYNNMCGIPIPFARQSSPHIKPSPVAGNIMSMPWIFSHMNISSNKYN